MAEVFGHIGDQPVELNNAASEATLRLLLTSSMASNKQTLDQLKKLGVEGGLFDETAWDEANQQVQNQTAAVSKSRVALGLMENGIIKLTPLFISLDQALSKLVEGTAKTSDMMAAFKTLPFGIGLVAGAFSRLLAFQEANMVAYEKMSNAGVNFGGSLTEVRLSASKMGLTLDQFAGFVDKNAEALVRLGGGTDQGMKSFVNLSTQMRDSDIGKNLRALGYTTEQVNQGMLNYINMTGGRTTKEMRNTDQLIASSAAYMEELDGLARISGKTREQQQAALDEASKNAAWQAKLATMGPEEKEKAIAGMAQALALGGKGAVDAFQSKLMGVAPDKAGQMFIATASKTAGVVDRIAADVTDKTKKSLDTSSIMIAGMRAAQEDIAKYGSQGAYAISRMGGPVGDALQALGITANKAATMTNAEIEATIKAAATKDSDAKKAVERENMLQKARDHFTTAMSNLFLQYEPLLTSALTEIVNGVVWVAEVLRDHGKLIGNTLITVIGAFALLKTAIVAQAAYQGARTLLGGAGAATTVAAPAAGGATAAAGGGLAAAIRGLGSAFAGLGPLAIPMLSGAAALSASIILVGGAIAGATWMVGKALPTFAEGLTSFGEIDGINLIKVAGGIGALGIAMAAFGATSALGAVGNTIGSVIGGITKLFGGNDIISKVTDTVTRLTPVIPALTLLGPAMQAYGNGLLAFGQAVNAIDISKAEKVADLIKKPAIAAEISKQTTASAAAQTSTTSSASGMENLRTDVKALNKTMLETIIYLKEISDNSRRSSRTGSGLFPAP